MLSPPLRIETLGGCRIDGLLSYTVGDHLSVTYIRVLQYHHFRFGRILRRISLQPAYSRRHESSGPPITVSVRLFFLNLSIKNIDCVKRYL